MSQEYIKDLNELTVTELKSTAPEYEMVLLHLQRHHQLKINGAQQLRGGMTKAKVYQVSVTSLASRKPASYILKLDQPIRWSDAWRSEAERLLDARASASAEFSKKHLPSLPYAPVELDNKIATLYTIANQSLQRCRPGSSYTRKPHLEQIFLSVGRGLLNEWNKTNGNAVERMHPQAILESWLSYRLDSTQGNIYDFLEIHCRIQPDEPGLTLEGENYPNPYNFATNRDIWRNARTIDVIKGFVHGDLHLGNILVEFSQLLENLNDYYFIDLNNFDSNKCLLFDHAYLELSYLLSKAEKILVSDWIACIQELADTDVQIRNELLPHDMAVVCDVIGKMRLAIDEWTKEQQLSRDDLWGLYRLAAVAAGLNFCNKPNVAPTHRYLALIYASIYLRSYCIWFEIPEPDSFTKVNFWQDPSYYKTGNYWEAFREACSGFGPDRLYILVAGPDLHDASESLKPLGSVQWSVVIDMDQNPEDSGLFVAVRGQLAEHRKLSLVTYDSQVSATLGKTTYWYAARGLQGRQGTIPRDETWLAWRQKYASPIRHFLTEMASNTAYQAITCVILWNDKSYLQTICELLLDAFDQQIDFVFAHTDLSPLTDLFRIIPAHSFPISPLNIAAGLTRLIPNLSRETQQIYMPRWEKSPNYQQPPRLTQVEIDIDTFNYLEEEMTLLHLHMGLVDRSGKLDLPNFLRGQAISWFELDLHQDVNRTKTAELLVRVQEDLKKGLSTRINLNHRPGAGGTTVARRVAWELHRTYPTVLLHRLSETTISRLIRLRRKTDSPILVVVETSAEVRKDLLEALYPQVRSEQIPTVFLLVQRQFEASKEDNRVFYLPEQLDATEASAFAETYSRECPIKREDLIDLAKKPDRLTMRVPFFFGLTAFEDEFIQIGTYVHARLEGMSSVERRVLCYIALAYQYGHQPLPAQILSNMLGINGSKSTSLQQALDRRRQSLLVQTRNDYGTDWRPRHYLIAAEILKQTLAPDDESGKLWLQRLADWTVQFIDDLASLQGSSQRPPSNYVIDLLKYILVFRNNQDVVEERITRLRFSRLIEDIPEHEGRIRVLSRLTDLFGEKEAHFWSHKARYLGWRKMYSEAREAITQALRVEPNNGVHHHILGMILRQMVQDEMTHVERQYKKKGESPQINIVKIDSLLEQAEQAFTKARELDPSDAYPYVSHIQMITRAIEFYFRISGEKSYSDFLVNSMPSKYADKLNLASELVDDVRRMASGELQSENHYITNAETELYKAFGDYNRVINGWQEALKRDDVYRPSVRRQIVYAYVNNAKERLWDNLSQREISVILQLMQENIDAELTNDSNVRLWFQAARRSDNIDIEQAIEYLQYWYSRSSSIEPVYYIYALHVLKAIEGSTRSVEEARRYIEECRGRARHLPNRTSSQNWLGKGEGMSQLVDNRRLGRWDDNKNFWANTNLLERVVGRIAYIDRAEAGWIELPCGLMAFFVPVRRRGSTGMDFYKDQDENVQVSFYLGLSYDNLRAWSVERVVIEGG